jgi:hypothetical protein
MVLVAAMALVACGRYSSDPAASPETGATGPDTTGPPDISADDLRAAPPDPHIWENPLGAMGLQVDDASALDELAYEPLIPSAALGTPAGVFVTDVAMTGKAAQWVAWTFDDAEAGRYILLEMPSGASQVDLEAPALQTPGCRRVEPTIEGADYELECVSDDFSLAKIRDGMVALVIQNEYITAISWLEPMTTRDAVTFADLPNLTLEIRLMAPAGKASLDALIAIANKL